MSADKKSSHDGQSGVQYVVSNDPDMAVRRVASTSLDVISESIRMLKLPVMCPDAIVVPSRLNDLVGATCAVRARTAPRRLRR